MPVKGLKIAVSGKGGVGKTTISSILCRLLAQKGVQVLAVDADPDANLGMALGFSAVELAKARTIAHDKALIKARTGAEPGEPGQWFTLNPRVSDIPEQYIVSHHGVRLLQMGNMSKGGSGCACAENTLLKTLLTHLLVEREEAIIVDMEAGIEHLGRGTAQAVDAFLVVVEPGQRSMATARTVARLAADLGIERVYAVANKVAPDHVTALKEELLPMPLIAAVGYAPSAVQADFQGKTPYELCPEIVAEVQKALDYIEDALEK